MGAAFLGGNWMREIRGQLATAELVDSGWASTPAAVEPEAEAEAAPAIVDNVDSYESVSVPDVGAYTPTAVEHSTNTAQHVQLTERVEETASDDRGAPWGSDYVMSVEPQTLDGAMTWGRQHLEDISTGLSVFGWGATATGFGAAVGVPSLLLASASSGALTVLEGVALLQDKPDASWQKVGLAAVGTFSGGTVGTVVAAKGVVSKVVAAVKLTPDALTVGQVVTSGYTNVAGGSAGFPTAASIMFGDEARPL